MTIRRCSDIADVYLGQDTEKKFSSEAMTDWVQKLDQKPLNSKSMHSLNLRRRSSQDSKIDAFADTGGLSS